MAVRSSYSLSSLSFEALIVVDECLFNPLFRLLIGRATDGDPAWFRLNDLTTNLVDYLDISWLHVSSRNVYYCPASGSLSH